MPWARRSPPTLAILPYGRRADRFIYFITINVVDSIYTQIIIRPSDLGPVLEREYYDDHQIAYCQNYTVIAPIKNGVLDGKLMAFDPFTHRLAWSCTYKRNVAHGELLYYDNDHVVVRYPIQSHDILLEETALECANCVLND